MLRRGAVTADDVRPLHRPPGADRWPTQSLHDTGWCLRKLHGPTPRLFGNLNHTRPHRRKCPPHTATSGDIPPSHAPFIRFPQPCCKRILSDRPAPRPAPNHYLKSFPEKGLEVIRSSLPILASACPIHRPLRVRRPVPCVPRRNRRPHLAVADASIPLSGVGGMFNTGPCLPLRPGRPGTGPPTSPGALLFASRGRIHHSTRTSYFNSRTFASPSDTYPIMTDLPTLTGHQPSPEKGIPRGRQATSRTRRRNSC
jgi:hypothetical protein